MKVNILKRDPQITTKAGPFGKTKVPKSWAWLMSDGWFGDDPEKQNHHRWEPTGPNKPMTLLEMDLHKNWAYAHVNHVDPGLHQSCIPL